MTNAGWSTTVLHSTSELTESRPELAGLFDRAGSPWSPVAHPAWLEAWWRSRPAKWLGMCVVIRSNGDLVAAIPLEFRRQRVRGVKVHKATTTNLSWGWTSALVDPSADPAWAAVFADWLADEAPPWSAFELGSFPTTAAAVQQLREQFEQRGWDVHAFERDMAHHQPPPGLRSLGKRDRHKMRRKLRDPRCGALTVDHLSAPSYPELARVLSEVVEHSWQGVEGVSVHNSQPGLYRELTRDPANRLELTFLANAEGRAVAYVLCLRAGSAWHAIDTGFDPRYADCSPGWIAWRHSMDHAETAAAARYDFGEASAYKTDHLRASRAAGTQLLVTRAATARWSRLVDRGAGMAARIPGRARP